MTAWGNGRRAFLGVCAATLVTALIGCGGGGGGGGTPSTTVVTGFVYNSAKQDEEVEGATVTMGGITGKTVTVDGASSTNPVGSFRLENVPVGTTTATVTFLNSRQIGDTDEQETFTDTQTITFFPAIARGSNSGIELFVNIGQVVGRVLLPGGTPAANANVFVAPSGLSTITDTEGNFLVTNVPIEPIEVTAVLGTSAGTKSVTLTIGTNNIGDLQLVEDPNPNPPGLPPTVRGTIRLEGGGVGSGANVVLLRDGSQIEQTVANTQGEYTFYVPTGNYAVRVFFVGYLDGSQDFVVDNPNQAKDISLTLQPRL